MRNVWDNTHYWILFVRAYFGCHMENRGAAFQCHLHFQGSVNRPSPKLVWFVSRQRECKKNARMKRARRAGLHYGWMVEPAAEPRF